MAGHRGALSRLRTRLLSTNPPHARPPPPVSGDRRHLSGASVERRIRRSAATPLRQPKEAGVLALSKAWRFPLWIGSASSL